LQSGELDAAQLEALRPVLAANLPPTAWVLSESTTAGRWMVYMGKYTNPADLAKKRAELTGLKVDFAPLTNPSLAPGLSLGVFSTQEAANTALQGLVGKGVRSARVLQERPPIQHVRLRLPALTAAQQPSLVAIRAALDGKALDACAAPAPN
jgi:hypothetical protein